MSTLDAVIILGGGAIRRETPIDVANQSEVLSLLPPWVAARVKVGCLIARQRQAKRIICTSAGTTHTPGPRDNRGFTITEAHVSAVACIALEGIAKEQVLLEAASYDTIGNAWYARIMHCEPAGLKRIAVVTSAFHMPRARAIFEWVFSLTPRAVDYELEFIETPDEDMDHAVLDLRREREAASLATLMDRTIPRVGTTVAAFHEWLTSEHTAYAFHTEAAREVIPQSVLNSY